MPGGANGPAAGAFAGHDALVTGPDDADTGRPSEPLVGLLSGVAVVLLGAPVGLLWSALSPRADLVRVPGGLTLRDIETKDFIAADGLLFVLGLVVGVALTAVAWRVARGGSPALLLGLVVGSAVAALVAARTGPLLDQPTGAGAAAGTTSSGAELPLRLHAGAALLGWPAGAATSFLALLARSRRRRNPVPQPDRVVEMGPAGPAADQTGPAPATSA